MKIISLLPGATETLCLLGLADQLVGISHACDFPADIQHLPRITSPNIQLGSSSQIDEQVSAASKAGTSLYELDVQTIRMLNPDLIVTQDLCNVCAVSPADLRSVAAELEPAPEILSLDADTLETVFSDILLLGQATQTARQAEHLTQSLTERLQTVKDRANSVPERPSTVLLEWLEPPYTAGHWTPTLIEIAGGRDLLGHANQKSQTISWETLYKSQPEKLMIACCGYSLPQMESELRSAAIRAKLHPLSCVRGNELYLIDGAAYLNRPGPRLVEAAEILLSILHPEINNPRLPKAGWSQFTLT